MTKDEQKEFTESILKGFSESMIEKIPHFPDHWDGFEIRRYMSEYFKEHYAYTTMSRKRLGNFRNELIVNQKLY